MLNLLTCGFHCWYQGERSRAEIGFELAKGYWGKAIKQEALEPVIDFGFTQMGLVIIEATVVRKLNFVRDSESREKLVYYYLL
ncbi:GNAT family N-acetyltransferase [Paenibacillus sp. CGMCC 1.16610]|uniref:N-acetyltransferase domain-containing protein n=1 Tax=Paenibacillus anseongense TaxID=2682845 RepID=A0ABW9U2T6_9BACL|nr:MULTISPECIES: GNAT family N-acetyltransferase [Paenibacillus]MBA2943229.1 GNAT family N-acetyltransferase [Paenibacillus sp. CGMCC 1.16610]MVQ33727.1 hypothetical protein [Paenibacillus anseongense]